jgi:hypothetical protein
MHVDGDSRREVSHPVTQHLLAIMALIYTSRRRNASFLSGMVI